MMTFRFLLAALALMSGAVVDAAQDCSRPKSNVERLICSNDRVSEANERLAFSFFLKYRRTPNDELRESIRLEQRDWETKVRDACEDVPCLLRAYEERTLYLDQN
ncbi:MAG: hypothetical protein K2Y35_06615 [Burkholderiales bacterium]|nr:hypothetical protein [Burkholderiales bacterium]